MQDKAKESCMVSFGILHSHLKVLSNNNLNETQFETGFERAFATLFDQDVQTFTRTIVLMTQLQTFINSRFSFDNDDGLMIHKYFIAHTRTNVQQFHVSLIQHIESVKKSIDERAHHKREYDIRVKERQMQSKKGKVDSSKALNAGLVIIESSGTESDKQDTSSRSGNDTDALDADIKLVSNEEPRAEIKKEIEALETINIELEHSVAKLLAENEKLHKENEHLKQTYKDLYVSIKKTRVQKKDYNDSLIAQINSKTVENADLKDQIQAKVFANVALKNELRK
ncbi:hypothetical protein Tco_0523057 [Tanacetum coccineum]